MRLGNPSIPLLVGLALASAPRLAAGQTEPTTTTPTATAEATVTVDATVTPPTGDPVAVPAPPPALVPPPAGGPETEVPWAAPPPPPPEPTPQAQPAQPGWGGQPAQPWGAEPGIGGEWQDATVYSLPEDQLLGYWPVVAELGVGYGLTAEGSLRVYNSAITLEPSAFLGLLPLWGMFQGPTLALPFGLPGSYTKTVRGEEVSVDHGLSVAVVPGYRILHPFRRDMFWSAGIGVPFLISEWQPSAKREYTFTPGLEVNGEFAYKFVAGLGVFARVTYEVFFGTYTLSTFGGTIGLLLYYEWFDKLEPPAPPADATDGQEEVWS